MYGYRVMTVSKPSTKLAVGEKNHRTLTLGESVFISAFARTIVCNDRGYTPLSQRTAAGDIVT